MPSRSKKGGTPPLVPPTIDNDSSASVGRRPGYRALSAAIEAVGEAILITDANLSSPGPYIQYANAAFTLMTGYSCDEVMGHSPRLLQGPNTDRAVLNRLREALEARQPFAGEVLNYRKDGTGYIAHCHITPVVDADGQVTQWVAALRDITERRQAEELQVRLLAEINHRVNNTLAAVQSMALQTLRMAPESENTRAAFLGRLFALARVHHLLARAHWTGASLVELTEAQLSLHRGHDSRRIETSGPALLLRPHAAITLGLALHELAVNAVTHGALSAPGGRVRLAWMVHPNELGEHLRLSWTEECGPPVLGPPEKRGFGVRILERALLHELRAKTRLLFEADGLRCGIDVPLDAVCNGRALPKRDV